MVVAAADLVAKKGTHKSALFHSSQILYILGLMDIYGVPPYIH